MGASALKKKRESGIELLRIILMIQIIFLHISEYGGYTKMAMAIGGETQYTYTAVWLLCRCPVPLLVILTGYFMVGKDYTWKQILPKWNRQHLVMWFYAIVITFGYCYLQQKGIFVCEEIGELTTEQRVMAFFPFFNRTWFFMTDYLLLLFLVPYLNRCLNGLNRRDYGILVFVLFLVFTVWTSLTKIEPVNMVVSLKKIVSNESGKSLYMFVFLYALGGYVRQYVKNNAIIGMISFLVFLALWRLNIYLVYYVEWYLPIWKNSDNPIVILQCICLLLAFSNLHFSSNVVNWISKNNMGVYLIHEHYIIRGIIWSSLPFLTTEEFYENDVKAVASIIGICIGIYIICNLIDFVCEKLVEGIEALAGAIARGLKRCFIGCME